MHEYISTKQKQQQLDITRQREHEYMNKQPDDCDAMYEHEHK